MAERSQIQGHFHPVEVQLEGVTGLAEVEDGAAVGHWQVELFPDAGGFWVHGQQHSQAEVGAGVGDGVPGCADVLSFQINSSNLYCIFLPQQHLELELQFPVDGAEGDI